METSEGNFLAPHTRLLDFCQRLVKNMTKKKEEAGGSETEPMLRHYEAQCKVAVERVSQLNAETDVKTLTLHLRAICKLVFDITYVDECEFLEAGVINDSSWKTVKGIIDELSEIVTLAVKVLQDTKLKDILGEDLLECLWWRKGALLYMYSHMANDQKDNEGKELAPEYKQGLEDGVEYFMSMFCSRATPYWLGGEKLDCEDEEDEKEKLLCEGIWSDNHMLALMYCGEMCYWHTKYVRDQLKSGASADTVSAKLSQLSVNGAPPNKDSTQSEGKGASKSAGNASSTQETESSNNKDDESGVAKKRDIIETGKLCLDKFITIAKWPVFTDAWNTERAEELLNYLKNLG